MKDHSHIAQAVEYLRKIIPGPILAKIEPELKILEDYILSARPPRIALIGRSGAGKSSLVNAIFGDFVAETGDVLATTPGGTWYKYTGQHGAMEVLDTRGVGDGEQRPEGSTEESAIAENLKAIHDRCPDVVLYAVKAADVRVWMDQDMLALKGLLKAIERRHKVDVPVIGVLTQVDLLAPSDIGEPPFADEEKQANIQTASLALEEILEKNLQRPPKVFATSAYMRKRGDTLVDRRWNIDTMVAYLVEQLPQQAQWEMAKLSQIRAAESKLAHMLVKTVASVAGVVGGTPIPGADIIPITGLQIAMVSGVAYLSGRELSRHDVLEFLAAVGVNVGVAAGLREFFRAAIKVVPVAGEIASAVIAYWGTYAVGQAAIAYYIERKSIEAAKRIRKDAQKPGEEAAAAAE